MLDSIRDYANRAYLDHIRQISVQETRTTIITVILVVLLIYVVIRLVNKYL